jgi:hypothetical protein
VSVAGVGDGLAPDRLVVAYEALRRQVLDAGGIVPRGAGAVLVIHRGLGAWMDACAQMPSLAVGDRREPPPHASPRGEAVPAEIVLVLASLLRSHLARRVR